MIEGMARAATTADVFNAIAEQQRREILVLLRAGEAPVTEMARSWG
jgi:DNA-binding transcriptional ArsR family regulator